MPERQATTGQAASQAAAVENPLDALLAPLQAWIEAKEAEQRNADSAPDSLPDDIPHFITRYP